MQGKPLEWLLRPKNTVGPKVISTSLDPAIVPPLPIVSGHIMKTLVNGLNRPRYWNVDIARFGQASLVTGSDGRIELRGGSRSDRTEAKEWISLFMHDAVPRVVPAN